MLKVYLAGEIHSNWREEIIQLCEKEKLEIEFSSPVTDHEASDNCGVEILGAEEKNFWKDRKGANINSIRTKKSIQDCDVIIVKFGEKYKQWNAAFDVGLAAAKGKPIITLHENNLDHALKEIDQASLATCRSVEEVVAILQYVISGKLYEKNKKAAE